jgi:2-succinyl-5-enolpyruvyl-6-hydroxy-3-cyclohexene-1-carboxylate synthase
VTAPNRNLLTAPNRNLLWGRILAQELARGGLRDICVSPGSRSAPIVLALHGQPGLRLTTHVDERSAGFFALGAAKATGRPVAVVTTSGTAAANLLPSVVEARLGRVPLVVLTADRPPELRDVGANQAIDQDRLFGRYSRFYADAGLPEPRPDRARHLRGLIGRALAAATGPPRGPVHLNFPFREPLDPAHVPGDVPADWAKSDATAEHGRSENAPFLRIATGPRLPDSDLVGEMGALVREHTRGLIVVGPRDGQDGFPAAAYALAKRTGYPILADPLSGLRYGAPVDAPVLSGYDAFLAHPPTRELLRPDLILRFGAAPTSRSLLRMLEEAQDAHHVLIDEGDLHAEPTHRASIVLAADAEPTTRNILETAPLEPDPAWTDLWLDREAATWSILERELLRRPFEGAALARLVHLLPPDALVYVSNSLPVRDLDRFGRGSPKPLRVLGSRGASGIDGVTSAALGAAHATGRRVTLAIGDLAFLHDMGALATARRLGIPIDILLINNDGGGIFELLPIARQDPPFTELFATPHGLDLAPLAAAGGLPHRRVSIDDAPRFAFEGHERGEVLEIVSDRKANVEHRRALEAHLAAQLEGLSHAP